MKTPCFQFEICANGVESCLAAHEGGADRVELCAGIPEGGTTPSYGEIRQARQLLAERNARSGSKTRLHVIIRPRGGDFLYSDLELDRMAMDIRMCHELGADGVVFGCLRADGSLHSEANARLLAEAQGMSTTFHRAFDRCLYPLEALEELIAQGFSRVLTSGQQATAELGIPLLRQLQERAGGRIGVMAGCGVREENIRRIHEETGVGEFHFSAREPVQSKMAWFEPTVSMGAADADEQTRMLTTAAKVRKTIEALAG